MIFSPKNRRLCYILEARTGPLSINGDDTNKWKVGRMCSTVSTQTELNLANNNVMDVAYSDLFEKSYIRMRAYPFKDYTN